MKRYFVYIIESREGYRYTGMTEDLDKRIAEHNNKELSFWTKRGSNWELLYKEEFDDKSEALKRERWFKSGVGREYLNSILEK